MSGAVVMTVPKRVVIVAWLAGVTAVGAGLWIVVRRAERRAAAEDRTTAALEQELDRGGGDAREHHRLGLSLAAAGNAEGLAHLELAAQKEPDNLEYGNDVRIWAVRGKQYDRSIRFFEGLAGRSGETPGPRLNLALAYVDKMPDHMMGIVGQGRLSKMSIAELTRILDRPAAGARPLTLWAATYALGKNHLYWPKKMRHAPAAEAAFRRCLEMRPDSDKAGSGAAGASRFDSGAMGGSLAGSGAVAARRSDGTAGASRSDSDGTVGSRSGLGTADTLPYDPGTKQQSGGRASAGGADTLQRDRTDAHLPSYFALAYERLGDALVKEGRHAEARAVWREGRTLFPNDADLEARLAIADDAALTTFIDTTRGLGVVVDTDLSVFWRDVPATNGATAAGAGGRSP